MSAIEAKIKEQVIQELFAEIDKHFEFVNYRFKLEDSELNDLIKILNDSKDALHSYLKEKPLS
jgi:hypothetical protein